MTVVIDGDLIFQMSDDMRATEFISQYQNLAKLIEQSMLRYADMPAFSCLGQTLTYREVDEASHAFACYCQKKLDLKAGDRIAIQLPNLIQYPIVMYGALRAGLVVVNTNPLYTPREMQHQFIDSGVKALVLLEDLLPKYQEIEGSVQIESLVVTRSDDLLTNSSIEFDQANYVCFTDALRHGQGLTLKPSLAKLDDVCVLQYTGGTTGISKGAILTHRSIGSNLYQASSRINVMCREGREVFVCPLPLYHIYAFSIGMLMQPLRGNLTILIPNPRDLDAFVEQIKPFKLTVFAGLNTLFVGLARHPEFLKLDFSDLNYSVSGGAALTEFAANLWMDVTGSVICEGYGLSETSPVLTLNDPEDILIGSVGMPVVETEIEFWDEEDQPVADGEQGQLVARGPQVMQGYWNMPDETKKVMKGGFFKTGDIGVRQPDGKIQIVDRLKDMIIVSGFNVFPNEVEEIVTQYPSVLEAAVIGEPDDKTGEKVCAFITVSADIDYLDLIDFCGKYLTRYKVPKKIVVLDELPKSSVGKVLRRELREVAG